MSLWDKIKKAGNVALDVGDAGLGLFSGGLVGNENFGFVDDLTGVRLGGIGDIAGNVGSGIENYFMGPTKAARAQEAAAREAGDVMGAGYDTALDMYNPFAQAGLGDFQNYRDMVNQGQFRTDTDPFMTNVQNYQRGAGPEFNAYQRGADPTYQSFNASPYPTFSPFQRGADPTFTKFERRNAPEFERAQSTPFEFNYQESPGFKHALEKGIGAIENRASRQGRRLAGGVNKEIADYVTGAVAQDYGNEFNRSRGVFESDRGFGERQANSANIFNQGQHQFETGIDVGQSDLANVFGRDNYQYGTNVDVGQSDLMNQANMRGHEFTTGLGFDDNRARNIFDQTNYQFGTGVDVGQSDLFNAFNQSDYQFGVGADQRAIDSANAANLAANAQNFGMLSGENALMASLFGGLGTLGHSTYSTLPGMEIDRGEAIANALLNVGNAKANRAMATQNTLNPFINAGAQLGAAYLGGMAGGPAGAALGSQATGYNPVDIWNMNQANQRALQNTIPNNNLGVT